VGPGPATSTPGALRGGHSKAARYWETCEAWEEAAALYRDGLRGEPLAEALYQRLIACCGKLGRRSEAAAAYRQCEHVLRKVLGAEPSRATRAALETAMGG